MGTVVPGNLNVAIFQILIVYNPHQRTTSHQVQTKIGTRRQAFALQSKPTGYFDDAFVQSIPRRNPTSHFDYTDALPDTSSLDSIMQNINDPQLYVLHERRKKMDQQARNATTNFYDLMNKLRPRH